MNKGKSTCKVLKDIRQKIANENGISYAPKECHYKGECKGTCPACEAEVRYLEEELNERDAMVCHKVRWNCSRLVRNGHSCASWSAEYK